MDLHVETVERVRAYWRAWEAQSLMLDRVSIVVIGHERFICAPERLRGRIAAEAPAELSSLLEMLGDEVEAVRGVARLSYTDQAAFRPVASDGVTAIGDDDARLAALRAASDPSEWADASPDEPCEYRDGVVERDSLLAVSTLRVWDGALGHVGVFTAAHARRHGLASKVGSAAVTGALTLGLVPQWRSRIENDASARVADRLGFFALGNQLTVRVRA